VSFAECDLWRTVAAVGEGGGAPSNLAREVRVRILVNSMPTHCFARIDGCRMHWVERPCVEPSGPPLVLLHGLNDCYRTWTHVTARLAQHRRVLVPDLPGHGLSDRPDASYELRWYAQLMTRWLEANRLETVDVVGHSFGGGVAQMMLQEGRQHIRRLVLVSSGGLGREIAILLRLASVPLVVERFGQPFMGAGKRLAIMAAGSSLEKNDVTRLTAFNRQRGSARAFARTVRDIIDWRGQRRSLFRRPPELQLPPMAVMWGDRDKVIPISHARALASAMDGVRMTVFDGCGHYLHHQKPENFVREVIGFLDDPTVVAPRPAASAVKARRNA
jgi:pimeloyl-ACP methyl ester carboxylesterase